MATGYVIAYPADLPAPQAAPLAATERRLMSDLPGPQQVRGIQRDYHAIQRMTWVLTAEQARRWDDWWNKELIRGGMWFAANWPLLHSRTNNVYRFHSAPRWEYMRGGPKGWGMHRVSAEVEVRGRGELPRNKYVLELTSRPYPVNAEDSLAVSSVPVSGGFVTWPVDHMNVSVELVGGELREPRVEYEYGPEEMVVNVGLLAGELKLPLHEYEYGPEEVQVTVDVDSGTLRVAVIKYENWPAEKLDVSVNLVSGTLS